MARMVELIREGAAPASMMRRAARGELSLPASEAIEILVALAGDRELGAEAEQTLAGWEEKSLIEVASNAAIPLEVLRYLLHSPGQRPAVVAALCENPALALGGAGSSGKPRDGGKALQAMMQSGRVRNSSRLLELMAANPAAEPARPLLEQWLAQAQGKEADEVAANFLVRHAEEVERETRSHSNWWRAWRAKTIRWNKLLTRVKKGETEVGRRNRYSSPCCSGLGVCGWESASSWRCEAIAKSGWC